MTSSELKKWIVSNLVEKECTHEAGWIARDVSLWFDENKIAINRVSEKRSKLQLVCNNPECHATRNGYLIHMKDGKYIVKLGKIESFKVRA